MTYLRYFRYCQPYSVDVLTWQMVPWSANHSLHRAPNDPCLEIEPIFIYFHGKTHHKPWDLDHLDGKMGGIFPYFPLKNSRTNRCPVALRLFQSRLHWVGPGSTKSPGSELDTAVVWCHSDGSFGAQKNCLVTGTWGFKTWGYFMTYLTNYSIVI